MDDGASFEFQQGKYRLRRFEFTDSKLVSTLEEGSAAYSEDTLIERVVIVGLGAEPTKVIKSSAAVRRRIVVGHACVVSLSCVCVHVFQVVGTVSFRYNAATDVLTLRKPSLLASEDWELRFEF